MRQGSGDGGVTPSLRAHGSSAGMIAGLSATPSARCSRTRDSPKLSRRATSRAFRASSQGVRRAEPPRNTLSSGGLPAAGPVVKSPGRRPTVALGEEEPMRKLGTAILISIIAGLAGVNDAAAFGQRSFVAAAGADVGTCTAPAPCRRFGYAIGQTTRRRRDHRARLGRLRLGRGDESRSQSRHRRGVRRRLPWSPETASTVAAGASDIVVLRGLTVNGLGATNGVAVLRLADDPRRAVRHQRVRYRTPVRGRRRVAR